MARIIFSLSGEGRGHATRVRTLIEHLRPQHEITVLAPGDAFGFLAPLYARDSVCVRPMPGLRFRYRDSGHLDFLRTAAGAAGYCEHGHFAVPECQGNRLGRAVGVAAGWGKRAGLRQVEHWFEERLGGWLRAIHPFDILRQIRQFTERQLAVATALSRLGGSARPPTIVCSHTHEVAAVGVGPVHASLHAATGATYANTGAWSSRFRLKRSGDTRVEWLEVGAQQEVRPRLALVPAIVRDRPLLSRLLTPFAGQDPPAESRHLDSFRGNSESPRVRRGLRRGSIREPWVQAWRRRRYHEAKATTPPLATSGQARDSGMAR